MAKKATPKKPATSSPAEKPAARKPAKAPAAVSPPPTPPPVAVPITATRSAGEAHREREAGRRRAGSASVREIGPLPGVVDSARRERGRKSLRVFCEEYFPRRFRLRFSASHLVAIDRMERCCREGGQFSCAMPRGNGKTTIAECAVIWAVFYGLRRFVVLICATNRLATRRLKQILRAIETNELLAEDFPEACEPIRRLERIHNRTAGQTLAGVPTRIELTAECLVLPTVPGAASSGAVVQVGSMEGAIRGLNVAGPDGEPLRPDMAVIDDAQTRESAKSPIQTADREAIVMDDVLGLAGPDIEIAAVMLCTVIYPNDLSDRFLSPDKHPEWRGVRTKMLEAFPERMELWDEYAEVRRESMRSGDDGKRANDLYAENRDEMDRGAKVSWPERKKKGELSGLQSAMNLYYTNPRGFRAEFQNDPEPEGGSASAKELRPDLVAARLSGLPRFEVPREASHLVAFIDAGGGRGRGIWYAVAAWDRHFGGSVVDYGTWPRQVRAVFAADDMRPGLAERYPGMASTAALHRGLDELTAEVLGRTYYREAVGEELKVELCLIDCGWETATVYQFVRAAKFPGVLVLPSKGVGRTATARGVSEWKPRPGERTGWHWRLTMSETGRGRMVQFDPDAWKTFLHERMTTPAGGRGYLSLYAKSAGSHELIAEHLAAETSEPVTLRGATFDKWAVRPHQPDNHLLDCVTGCCLAASVQGLVWSPDSTGGQPPPQKRKKVDIEELYKKARQGDAA